MAKLSDSKTYIYERNPDTGEVFRRERNNYNKRELIEVTTIKTKKENNMEKISLFDYLGRKAGPELGLKVATAAGKAGVITETRDISNPVYKGTVKLYPKAFLDLYFRNGLNESTSGKQLLKG